MKRMKKAVVSLAVIVGCTAFAAGVTSCGAASSPQQAAASRFLAKYTGPDGRVVRLDQGRDTVSEGQAYGMLLAEVAGDYRAFQRIWLWTHRHLQHRDGLFSFHTNARGKVTSRQPASDADLLIAWALLRYSGPKAAVWQRAAGAVRSGRSEDGHLVRRFLRCAGQSASCALVATAKVPRPFTRAGAGRQRRSHDGHACAAVTCCIRSGSEVSRRRHGRLASAPASAG